jgi:hypothetical protein
MPEWYFLLFVLCAMVLLGFSWPPLFWLAPLLVFGVGSTLIQAAQGGDKASFHPEPASAFRRICLQLLVAWFHLVQPAARLVGRIQHGLGPWHWRRLTRTVPARRVLSFWCEEWQPNEARLADIEQSVHRIEASALRGGDFDGWDLEIRGGLFGCVRSLAMVEEHGAGKQLFRMRLGPECLRAWLEYSLRSA